MFEIFYYINKNNFSNILNYGIKLSDNYTRKVINKDSEKLYITGLLNPKDDIEKFNDENYICIRFNINNINLKIAESSLYETEYYASSIINLAEYKLGQYMNPEVLISFSILPENIEQINYYIDSPLLYNNSKELYFNNTISILCEKLNNSNDIILKALLEEYGKANNFEIKQLNDKKIYYSKESKEIFTI